MLGKPGQGKTAAVDQVVNEYQQENPGKKVLYWSLRLNQCDPTDIKGVPLYAKTPSGLDICKFAVPDMFPIQGVPDSAPSMI